MFNGSLSIDKMNPVQKRAYKSWKDQGQRCTNPKNSRFPHYKNVQRCYSSREFIIWYEHEFKKLPPEKHKQRVHVGRIDHGKDYTFGNVRLELISDSVKERNSRCGNPTPSKSVIARNVLTGECRKFCSQRKLARELGMSRNAIKYQKQNGLKRKPTSGWILLF